MIKEFNLFFLTLFYIGRIKYAPGTIASIITCIIFFLLVNLFNVLFVFIFTLVIFFYSFIALNNSYEKFDTDDPQEIVIDEFIGQLLPLLFIPIYETLYLIPVIYYCLAAFILFRIFDIWKPFPINFIDNNVEGALGILLDDIIAGLYSIIILIAIFFFLGGYQ